MFIEVPYNDSNGTICPICGSKIKDVNKSKEDTPFDGVSVKSYTMTCVNNHLTYYKTEAINGEDDYFFGMRSYVSVYDVDEFGWPPAIYTNGSIFSNPLIYGD